MNRKHLIASFASALALGGAVTLVVQGVRAAGIPPTGALTYAGLLQDATGQPLTGTQFIEVKFWNDAAASAAANLLCDTGSPAGIGLVNGRFSIPLPDACTTKVGANPGIWVEVLEGSAANSAASLGRTKVGAVPFAVEANHAVNADMATTAITAATATAAGGTLASAISALQSTALTSVLGSELNLTDPITSNWHDLAVTCITNGNGASAALPCNVAANRKCVNGLGYRAGWYIGEGDGNTRGIVCIK